MLVLYPYLLERTWVFDDAATGLKEEAFVLGASEMISRLVKAKRIPKPAKGFEMTFSDEPFAGADVELSWVRPDPGSGNWYQGDVAGERMECWLCPALFCYFDEAPPRIFVRAESLPKGVNPIWTPEPEQPGRRFVGPPQP
jgi:hypothetical protein